MWTPFPRRLLPVELEGVKDTLGTVADWKKNEERANSTAKNHLEVEMVSVIKTREMAAVQSKLSNR